MPLLPSEASEISSDQEGELQVLGIDDADMDAVFEALSSSTARSILATIYDTPGTASEVADRTGNSIQTVVYHLDELQNADLIQVADTQYSEKGKEMNVYAPADDPVIVFVGTEERKTGFLSLLKRLAGATALLLISLILIYFPPVARQGSGPPSSEGLISSPELAFITGGMLVISLVLIWWIWNRYSSFS